MFWPPDRPTPPLAPVDIIESSSSAVEFKWRPPKDDGGSPITNYLLERQQLGRNSWKKLGQIPGEPKYRDTDVDHVRKYCYHIRAVTEEGISEMMETDDLQAGTKGGSLVSRLIPHEMLRYSVCVVSGCFRGINQGYIGFLGVSDPRSTSISAEFISVDLAGCQM